jgi:hypothetical protein
MKRIAFATATIVAALMLAGIVATTVARAAEAQQSEPAAQSSQAPAPEAGPQGSPMMHWHQHMHGGPMGPMGPGGPMAGCPCIMGGPGGGMGPISGDPKLRAEMMQLQGEMMKKMGELMERRARELQSGK